MSAPDLVRRILAVQRMTTGELKAEIERLTGQPSRTFNRPYLVRRVAFLIQAEAKQGGEPTGGPDAKSQVASLRIRDARLPAPGAEFVKVYKGQEIRVRVLDDGFEWNGIPFPSLTALAKALTGQKFISGFLFFGLAKRKRPK